MHQFQVRYMIDGLEYDMKLWSENEQAVLVLAGQRIRHDYGRRVKFEILGVQALRQQKQLEFQGEGG